MVTDKMQRLANCLALANELVEAAEMLRRSIAYLVPHFGDGSLYAAAPAHLLRDILLRVPGSADERRRLGEWAAICALRRGRRTESALAACRRFELQGRWCIPSATAATAATASSVSSVPLLWPPKPRRLRLLVWRRFTKRAATNTIRAVDYRAVVERTPHLYAQGASARILAHVCKHAVECYEARRHHYGYGGASLHAGVAIFSYGMMCACASACGTRR
jgi:hypothetical protein